MKLLFFSLLFVTLVLTPVNSKAEATCSADEVMHTEDVLHTIDTSMPKHLKGAKITVVLADGTTSTVPAERFMVVPRKQKIVAGQNKHTTRHSVCTVKGKEKKNIVMVDVEREWSDLDSETSKTSTGVKAKVTADKTVVPGINYYRRQLLDSPIGAGLGVDTNGSVKGMLGVDF